MLDYLKYIILGLIQGITEVLPISSSGHLIMFEKIFNIHNNNLSFEVFLHLASLISILLFLSKDIKRLINSFFKYLFKKDENSYDDFKYIMFLIISTMPIVFVTILLKNYLNNINKLYIVGICLIINSIMIYIFSFNSETINKKDLKIKHAVVIGLFECLGIFPGISRSGSTISGANVIGLNKKDGAEYSFFLFIPTILGAVVLEGNNLIQIFSLEKNLFICYLLAFITTIFTTYFSFKFLLKIIKKGKLKYFSLYCLTIGIIVLIYSIINNFI